MAMPTRGYGTAGNGGLVMTPYHPVFIQKYAIRSIIFIIYENCIARAHSILECITR